MKKLIQIVILFLLATQVYSQNTNCDSTTFHIQKPNIAFTDSINMFLCNDSEPLIELEIYNNDTLTSDSIFIDYYCIEDSSGFLIPPCLFMIDTITSIAGLDTLLISSEPDSLCTDCVEMMAVLSGNCICENDTITFNFSDAVYTPTVTDIFSISPCLYAGAPMYFGSTTTGAVDYLWSFGNGDTSTVDSAAYVFPTGGYYCITLEVSNECDPYQYSETFYILPDVCGCDSLYGGTVSYDIPDSTVLITSESWNYANYPSGEIFVEGDVFIKQDSVLIIDSVTVKFSPKGKIIVERGGMLLIKDAATLTKLDNCDYMWQGIEVWGLANSPLVTGMQHGRVTGTIHNTDNNTIEHAHIGILIGKRNLDYICTGFHTEFDLDFSGGLARLHNIDFKNNGVGIKGLRKDGLYRNDMLLDDCNFESTTLIDPLYNSNNTVNYPVPTYPFVHSSPKARTTAGIWLNRYDVDFVFENNTFHNIDTCMKSYDSKFTVDSSSFDKASYGIYAIHTFVSFFTTHIIKNSTFDRIHDDLTNEGKAIFIENGLNDKIYNNDFNNSTHELDSCDIAIQLDNTFDHEITENEIKYYKKGIIANNNISGYVGANEPLWEGNFFDQCYKAIETNWINNTLILKCNDHTPNIIPSEYDVNWDNSGTLGNQGANGTNPDDPAGNSFLQINIKEINSASPYMYYHHLNDTSIFNIYRPTLQSGSVFVDRVPTGADYISNFDACSDTTISIPLQTFALSNPPFSQLEEMNIIKNDLNNTLNDMLSNIDGGATQELLDAITGNMSGGKLKNKLLNHSPLSDTVIYTLIIEDALSPGNFKNVTRYNLPVSNMIVEDFYNYTQNLPQGIKSQLLQMQIENPGVVTPAGIERELGQLQTVYYHLLDKIVTALLDTLDYRKDDAIALLEYDGSAKSKIILFGTYLNDNNFVNAQRILNEIAANETALTAYFVELHQITLELYEQNKSIHDMENNDFDFVYYLANTCPPNPAVYNAKAIVKVLKGEHIPDCPIGFSTKEFQFSIGEEYFKSNKQNQILLGDNYPDPFTEQTTIPYKIPEETEGKIIVINILGEKIEEFTVKAEEFELIIKTNNWVKGVYYYTLIYDNEIIDTKKMIIQ